MSLAKQAEDAAAAAIAAMQGGGETMAEETPKEDSPYMGGYLVVSGDSLWGISAQDTIYGDPYLWPLIYKANSGQIKDADLIYPGQYFYIPKAKGPEASDLDYLAQ